MHVDVSRSPVICLRLKSNRVRLLSFTTVTHCGASVELCDDDDYDDDQPLTISLKNARHACE